MKIADHRDRSNPAAIEVPTGRHRSFADLEARSNAIAHLLRGLGVTQGGHIAILLENRLEYFDVVWAAQRSGIYYTPVNWHLAADEASFVVGNCDATVLITSARLLTGLLNLTPDLGERLTILVVGDENTAAGSRLEDEIAGLPTTPISDELEGAWMFYSSGTTGRPKGITPSGLGEAYGGEQLFDTIVRDQFGFRPGMVFCSPAPLYHAAPLGWTTAAQKAGGTVILTEGFDAAQTLELIAQHRVTHAQFVPTHFVRLLKLDDSIRRAADISSLEVVVHAAAPCPVSVKDDMLAWFGPIISEFYSGSEGVGFCQITAHEWLKHRGSVGKPAYGAVHILDSDGREVDVGEIGEIWFETPTSFTYHRDDERTAAAWNDQGFGTFGDIGYVDDESYLYLTDRGTDLVISGGVNLYPREAEDVLITHPTIDDVACLGLPDDEWGEVLIAVVQSHATTELAAQVADLDAFVSAQLSRFKCPRGYYFAESLPRLPTGKLLKRHIDRDAVRAALIHLPRTS